jgi:hypothetical protein
MDEIKLRIPEPQGWVIIANYGFQDVYWTGEGFAGLTEVKFFKSHKMCMNELEELGIGYPRTRNGFKLKVDRIPIPREKIHAMKLGGNAVQI